MADVARKLQIKPGEHVLAIDAPAGLEAMLRPLPDDARLSRDAADRVDVVLLFAPDMTVLREAIPALRKHAGTARSVWVAYPKKSSTRAGDISRDVIRTALDGSGITPVTQIALDDTWSALRVRPIDRVGRGPADRLDRPGPARRRIPAPVGVSRPGAGAARSPSRRRSLPRPRGGRRARPA